MGAGGEGGARGVKAVDFKQGTCENGEFATIKQGIAFPSKNIFSLKQKCMRLDLLHMCAE